MPSPTASTMPAPSLWGTVKGKVGDCPAFRRLFTSEGLTPETLTRTRTSPGPGSALVAHRPSIQSERAHRVHKKLHASVEYTRPACTVGFALRAFTVRPYQCSSYRLEI